MRRRDLLKALLGLPLLPLVGRAEARPVVRSIWLQESPVAGFQYHSGEDVWPSLFANQALRLRREPDNRHDKQAVAVYWREHKLGYLPRTENTAVAQMLDRGESLRARITRLRETPNPWERVRLTVFMEA